MLDLSTDLSLVMFLIRRGFFSEMIQAAEENRETSLDLGTKVLCDGEHKAEYVLIGRDVDQWRAFVPCENTEHVHPTVTMPAPKSRRVFIYFLTLVASLQATYLLFLVHSFVHQFANLPIHSSMQLVISHPSISPFFFLLLLLTK